MNEITNALRVINATYKTVRVMDVTKKVVVASAAAVCCLFAFRFWKNR